jgi:hypothetical protein
MAGAAAVSVEDHGPAPGDIPAPVALFDAEAEPVQELGHAVATA